MARISHCGKWVRPTDYRVWSEPPAYKFQHLYVFKCKGKCRRVIRYWCGEFSDGSLTELIPVSPEEFRKHWKKRLKKEKPRPKAQITSEYSQRIKSGNIDAQVRYQNRIKRALKQGF